MRRPGIWLGIALAGFISAGAYGAAIPWSNPSGVLPGVFSWTNGQTENGLYGSPTVSANTFAFIPNNFRAIGSNGGSQNVTDRITFDLDVAPGLIVESIDVREFGDYAITGGGTVSSTADLGVVNRDLGPGSLQTASVISTPAFPLSTVSNDSGLFTSAVSRALPFGWTRVTITLDGAVSATGAASGTAAIEKKLSGLLVTVNVPEPGAIALGLAGVGALLLRRRCRA